VPIQTLVGIEGEGRPGTLLGIKGREKASGTLGRERCRRTIMRIDNGRRGCRPSQAHSRPRARRTTRETIAVSCRRISSRASVCQPKYGMCLSMPSCQSALVTTTQRILLLRFFCAAHHGRASGQRDQPPAARRAVRWRVPLPGGRTGADVKTPAHDLACLSVAFPSTVTASRFDRR
jgi:hypothetical protein